jgi:tRNA (cmo5U34)-methyltransferase
LAGTIPVLRFCELKMAAAVDNVDTNIDFDAVAQKYDAMFARIKPMKDCLHLGLVGQFSKLPPKANILCVGVGTGDDILALSPHFPDWTFTAVEPSHNMMEVCRKRLAHLGTKCTFHEGYLDTLPTNEGEFFDAATSILVAQFVKEQDERVNFFRQIESRLKPGGYLVSCDLSADAEPSADREFQFKFWCSVIGLCENINMENYRVSIGELAILPRVDIEDLIAACGFNRPNLFYQFGLMHGWCSVKA